MSAKVSLLARRLTQIRKEMGLSQEEVAQALGITREYLSMLESGKRKPTMSLLQKIAEFYARPVRWFYGAEESEGRKILKSLLQSKIPTSLSSESHLVLERFLQWCDELSTLERLLGITLSPLPRYDWDTEPTLDILKQFAEEIATAERARLHLGDQPVRDIFALLEGQGVKVFRLEAPEDEIDGAMVYDTVLGAFLFVNAKHSLGKQNFIAAHQYAHLLKDRDEGATLCRLGDLLDGEREREEVSRKERFANLFAAAFLMPKATVQSIVELFEGDLSEGALVYLRRQFGVNYEALFLRLKELGYWTAEEVAMWKERRRRLMSLERTVYGSADEPLPPDSKGIPILLLLRGWEAYRKGLISRNRVAELLKMTTMDVDDLVAEGGKIASVR